MTASIDSLAKCELTKWLKKTVDSQWMHTNSHNKTKKFRQTSSNRNVMARVLSWKKWLEGQHFPTIEESQDTAKTHLNSLPATFYEDGIGTLVHGYDKCLNLQGDNVEK